MNFLLTSNRENVQKRPAIFPCSYCQKAFTNSRALGGHLRSHQDEARSRRSWNVQSRPINSLNIISPTQNPLVTTEIMCQFNTDQSRAFRDGEQFFGNSLPNFHYRNHGHLCCPDAYAVAAIPNPHFGSNQLPVFKEHSSNMVPLLPYRNRFLGQEEFSRYNKNRIFTREGGKRRCLGEAPRMRAVMKRPKMINCNPTLEREKPQKKELLLFKDVENSFSGLVISSDHASEQLQTDLDLSLHL